MLPILISSMIINHLRDTLLHINYLSFLKPLLSSVTRVEVEVVEN